MPADSGGNSILPFSVDAAAWIYEIVDVSNDLPCFLEDSDRGRIDAGMDERRTRSIPGESPLAVPLFVPSMSNMDTGMGSEPVGSSPLGEK